MELIAIFDFDGTLIKRDSMVLFFLRYFNFSWKNILNLFQLALATIKFFLKIYSQKKYKEKFLNLVINSSKIKDPEKIADGFSEYLLRLVFKDAKKEISKLKENGFSLVRRSGSHKIYRNKSGERATIPYHAGKILHPKTLISILRDVDLTVDKFKGLMK
ncbi:unnamed protein product [marine sediment metagenome]|uniref:Addiction module toxin, HicA family n=1 Tax=marine sediment metagenome TaxID=412755 RepID=X0ZCE3_9ZZZZ